MCCGHGVQEKSELLFQPMTGDTLLTELSSLCDDKDLLGQDLLHAANSCLPGAAIDDGTDSASCCLRHGQFRFAEMYLGNVCITDIRM